MEGLMMGESPVLCFYDLEFQKRADPFDGGMGNSNLVSHSHDLQDNLSTQPMRGVENNFLKEVRTIASFSQSFTMPSCPAGAEFHFPETRIIFVRPSGNSHPREKHFLD
jgi:hypothetical protein